MAVAYLRARSTQEGRVFELHDVDCEIEERGACTCEPVTVHPEQAGQA